MIKSRVSEQLSPCRLCGTLAQDIDVVKYFDLFSVLCPKCFNRGKWKETRVLAIKEWNDERNTYSIFPH